MAVCRLLSSKLLNKCIVNLISIGWSDWPLEVYVLAKSFSIGSPSIFKNDFFIKKFLFNHNNIYFLNRLSYHQLILNIYIDPVAGETANLLSILLQEKEQNFILYISFVYFSNLREIIWRIRISCLLTATTYYSFMN